MDLPGFKSIDFKVEMVGDEVLQFSGSSKTGSGGVEGQNATVVAFDSKLKISGPIGPEVKAVMKDGVLTVMAPRLDREPDVVNIVVNGGAEKSGPAEGTDGDTHHDEKSFEFSEENKKNYHVDAKTEVYHILSESDGTSKESPSEK